MDSLIIPLISAAMGAFFGAIAMFRFNLEQRELDRKAN